MAGTTDLPDYETPYIPEGTPPVIADAMDAATRPDRDGDIDFPGSSPDEVQPQQEPPNEPGRAPDEVTPDGGDWDEPDSTPVETPPLPETPAAPD